MTTDETVDDLADFIDTITEPDQTMELRCIKAGAPPMQRWCKASEVTGGEIRACLREQNAKGYNIYIGANPRRGFGLTGNENVAVAYCLFGDFDGGTTVEHALKAATDAGLPPPTLVMFSGHGVHVYWRFAEPFTNLAIWTERMKDLAAALGSDPKICNPERIMRLPGFKNTKKEPHVVAHVVECSDRRYACAEFLPLLPKRPDDSGNGQRHAEPVGDGIDNGQRNSTLTSLGGTMRKRGMGESAILAALLAENTAKCRPPLDEDEVRSIAKSVLRYEPDLAGEYEPPPAPTPLGELWKSDAVLSEPIIDGLFRRGEVANIISTSKSYKTYLILCLAISMVVCRQWLERFGCRGGRVLIIDLELQKASITRRTIEIAKAMQADLQQVADGIDVVSFRGRSGTINQIEKLLLAEKPGTWDLAIVDPLYKTYPRDFDENSNAQMTALYRRWERIAEHLHCGLVIVHHGTKGSQSEKRVVDVGAGASAQSRSADCHIALREHDVDGCVVFDSRVRSFPPVEPMVLRWEYPLWNRDLALNPADLKTGRKSRNLDAAQPQVKEKPEPWTVDRFVTTFITDQPQARTLIVAKARQAGVPTRQVEDLILLAMSENRAFKWTFPRSNTVHLASREQPVTETSESAGKTGRKSTKKGAK